MKVVKLGEIGKIITGCTPSTKKSEYYASNDYMFVGPSDIKNVMYVVSSEKHISEKAYEDYKTRFINENSIVVDCIGSDMGNVAIIKEKCLTNQQINAITNIDESNYNIRYVYYVLSTMKNYFHLIGTNGSTMPILNKTMFENIEIEVPDIETQDKIANVLSKLDDKIKLNNEINNNLYDLSNSIYKQWFEKYDFPNFNGRYKDSELGMIPENWDIGYFDDFILTKIIKSGVKKFEGLKKYVATADVSGTNITSYEKIKYDNKPSRANMTPIISSIWFAKMENSVKNILVDSYMSDILDNYIFSTGFMGIECFNNSLYYMWNLINDDKFLLEKNSLSTGTLMAGISNSTIKNYKYLIPDNKTLELFNKVQIDINKEIYNNNVENEKLSQLRDTLLPKLMNVEIDLDNIEV